MAFLSLLGKTNKEIWSNFVSRRPKKSGKNWRSKFHRLTPAGLPPGTLIQDPEALCPVIQLVAYDNEKFVECCIHDTALIK